MSWRKTLGVVQLTETPSAHNPHNVQKAPESSPSADTADCARRRSEEVDSRQLEVLTGGPPESLDWEARFGSPHARLYPFLGQTVSTPAGRGKLLQVFTERAAVVLDHDPGRVVFLLPSEVEPPGVEAGEARPFEAVH
jgi:hypothetical protein